MLKLHTETSVETSMSKPSQRHFLKEKEGKQLLLNFSRKLKVDTKQLFGHKPHVELTETPVAEIIVINNKPLLARYSSGMLFPTLIFKGVFSLLPKIVVDMGAVPHICGGADVMAPGVVRIDGNFSENDLLLIVDERYGKSLAIGVALFSLEAMKGLKHGKIVKNIHYVGDALWNFIKTSD